MSAPNSTQTSCSVPGSCSADGQCCSYCAPSLLGLLAGFSLFQERLAILAGFVLFFLLVIAVRSDLMTRKIPNYTVIGIAASGLVFHVAAYVAPQLIGTPEMVAQLPTLGEVLLATLVIGGGLLLFSWAYQKKTHTSGMGAGDIKLIVALTLWLGWWMLPVLAVALAVAALIGVGRILKTRRKEQADAASGDGAGLSALARTQTFAFAPYVASVFAIVLVMVIRIL